MAGYIHQNAILISSMEQISIAENNYQVANLKNLFNG